MRRGLRVVHGSGLTYRPWSEDILKDPGLSDGHWSLFGIPEFPRAPLVCSRGWLQLLSALVQRLLLVTPLRHPVVAPRGLVRGGHAVGGLASLPGASSAWEDAEDVVRRRR